MTTTNEALEFLGTELEKRIKTSTLSFNEYLEYVKQNPEAALRSIFQLFHDMVKTYVEKGVDDYPDDPESIGFIKYDCSRLLVDGADNPYFVDTLFANRLIRQVESLRQGFQQNRVYAYLGPSGCGKSTFLNNLLKSFEIYTNSERGRVFEIVWEIDEELFIKDNRDETHETLIVPCPSHDHPISIIPRGQRAEFLVKLLPDSIARFKEKEYDWLTRTEACTICKSLFWSSFEKLGSLDKILRLVKVRPYKFDRRVGEGISIFNPGDKPVFGLTEEMRPSYYFTNRQIQERLDKIFGANAVRYIYSHLAKTNNGIYVLMDVKMSNEDRLMELHNVISEGVHKVGDIEEYINSLFFALMNPEDKKLFEEKKLESLQGRIQESKLPFVLEPSTEVNIFLANFGETVRKHFLSGILENFARVIIASRMNEECKPLKEWIPNLTPYSKNCDKQGLLLRMEIYSGVIPEWLNETDKKKFTADIRRKLVAEGENEGNKGFSGRQSLRLFNDFFNRYKGRLNLINMDNVRDFFTDHIGRDVREANLPPKGFLDALVNSYNFRVLNEVKEALYPYNEEQISRDILNYIWAANLDVGTETKCPFTGEEIEVTIDFLRMMASSISGEKKTDKEALEYTTDIQERYSALVARETYITKTIRDTDLYRDLLTDYARNLKEDVLTPFATDGTFKEAIRFFDTKEFEAFDRRLKENVARMIKNLIEKFGYSEQGAKEVCLYVIDKGLPKKFS